MDERLHGGLMAYTEAWPGDATRVEKKPLKIIRRIFFSQEKVQPLGIYGWHQRFDLFKSLFFYVKLNICHFVPFFAWTNMHLQLYVSIPGFFTSHNFCNFWTGENYEHADDISVPIRIDMGGATSVQTKIQLRVSKKVLE